MITAFRDAMAEAGLSYAGQIEADGTLHRFRVDGDKQRNCWYVLFNGEISAGAFGCWKRNISGKWHERQPRDHDEANRFHAAVADAKAKAEAERQKEREAARKRLAYWMTRPQAQPAAESAYIQRKQVRPSGSMFYAHGRLVVPLENSAGEVCSVQFIDDNGLKLYMSGLPVAGLFYRIPGNVNGRAVYICEGIATGLTVAEATGCEVYCAMTAGNLLAVAKLVRDRHPAAEIVIAGDNDQFTPDNPGLTKATASAKAIGARLAVPSFTDTATKPTDFNDLFLLAGIEETKRQLTMATPAIDEAQPAALTVIDTQPINAEAMYADMLERDLGPTKTIGSDWFRYNAGAWGRISKATLRPRAQNILPYQIRTARREATILDHLEGRLQTPDDSFRGFNCFTPSGDILLNVANGVLRVSATGELRLEPHSPEHLFLHKLAASYDPKATAPLFRRVLGEALPDEEDQIVYQLCAGNFLFPDSRYEVALVNYGHPGRSKSTCAEPVAGAIGKDLVPRLTMSQLCDSRSYYVPKLRYAAVNLGTELDAVELDDSGAFKAIVSGEEIEARSIYGAPFTMGTSCKLWFLANHLPRFKHGTEAELRRTRFLRFDYEPPKLDVTIKSRLPAERSGVFLWMVNGLLDLLSVPAIPRGGAESCRVHDRFRVSNDPVGAFVSTCCVIDPAATVSKDTIREAYREFCEKHGLSVNLGEWFFRVLYERWPNLKDVRRRQEGERVQSICGIQLKP